MRFLHDEKGQALVLTATSLLVMMGLLAFATDLSVLFHDRREMQTAADGAAVAAATEALDGGTSSEISAAADAAAASNGFTNDSNNVTVTVHDPPTSGYHQTSGFFEVDIRQSSIPTVLMGLFGAKTVNVSARAVGSYDIAGSPCIWLGNSTGTDLKIQGSATINASGCGIYLNSTSSNALDTIGNGNTVDAAYIALIGGSVGSGSPQGTAVTTDVQPESNPLASDVAGNATVAGAPTSLSACQTTNSNTTITTAIDASGGTGTSTNVYCFSGTNVNITGATLSNGVFIFENGVTLGGAGNTTTITNGTLDLYGGAYNQGSSSSFNITAPAIAPPAKQWNNGIAIYVPTTNTQYAAGTACSKNPNDTSELMIQFGSSNQNFSGYIYAPNATVTLHDQGGGTTATGLIAGTLCDLSGTINITSYNAANPTTTPVRTVALVE